MTRRHALVAALSTVAACTGDVGLFDVELVHAPGSTVLDTATRARLTLTDPLTVVESTRGPDGFNFELDVVANGQSSLLLFEAFDAAGAQVAVGRTPPLPIAAISAPLALYVATPLSFAEAPVALPSARDGMGAALMSYGVIVAGGHDASAPALDDVLIYSAYAHAFATGEPLPEARDAPVVAVGVRGVAYVFGGRDAAGVDGSTLWRFDTDVAPAGLYLDATEQPGVTAVGHAATPLGGERFLLTGGPAHTLDGFRADVTALDRDLPRPATSMQAFQLEGQPIATVIVGAGAGTTGLTVLRQDVFADFPFPVQLFGHGVATTQTAEALIIGGQVDGVGHRTAYRFDPFDGSLDVYPDALAVPRRDAAIAVTSQYVIVAGGRDDDDLVRADAEVLDAETLAPVATLPLRGPRQGARAFALGTGQVLLVGGTDAAGAPSAQIELFTPPLPLP